MISRIAIIVVLTLGLLVTPYCDVSIHARSTEEKLKKIQRNKATTTAELKKMSNVIEKKKKEINDLEELVLNYDNKIEKYLKDIDKNENLLEKEKVRYNKIIYRLYVKGDCNYMTQLLSANNLHEFIHRLQTIRLLVKQEKETLDIFVNLKLSIEEQKQNIERAKADREPLLLKGKEQLEILEKIVIKQKNQLKHLEHEEELTRAELQRINKAGEKYKGNYGTGRFVWPVAGGSISSPYGYRGGYFHKGIDIPRPIGTPIYAADSGVVSYMKANPGGYGYYIVITHGKGLSTLYAHMYRSTVAVSIGQHVSKGQIIAKVGNNGNSSGPHLHFEVHRHGKSINPKSYL